MAAETVEMDEKVEAKRLGAALAELRKRAGLSQPEAAEAAGLMSGEGWRKYEVGASPGIFRPAQQKRLAEAVGATREQLLQVFNEAAPRARVLPLPRLIDMPAEGYLRIRDRVQAGAWLRADDVGQDEPPAEPVAKDPRFMFAAQWLSIVVGDSMNLKGILDGDLAHFVDAIAIGYYPKTGDIVEVERTRFDGQERELTIKEVEMTGEGPILWPRSTNERWQQPLDLRAGIDGDEDIVVRIRGLLLKTIRRF